jgi:transposase, IS5 family
VHEIPYFTNKTCAFMIQYTPANQLTLEGFEHPFDLALDPDNRWVKLAGLIDWDELAGIYSQNLKTDKGRLSDDLREPVPSVFLRAEKFSTRACF